MIFVCFLTNFFFSFFRSYTPKLSADTDKELVDSAMTLEAIPFTSKPARRIPALDKPTMVEKVRKID